MHRRAHEEEEKEESAIGNLNNYSSDSGNPADEARHTSESSRHFNFATVLRAEADDAHLIVDSVINKAQWATRITLHVLIYRNVVVVACNSGSSKIILTLHDDLPPTVDTQMLLAVTVSALYAAWHSALVMPVTPTSRKTGEMPVAAVRCK